MSGVEPICFYLKTNFYPVNYVWMMGWQVGGEPPWLLSWPFPQEKGLGRGFSCPGWVSSLQGVARGRKSLPKESKSGPIVASPSLLHPHLECSWGRGWAASSGWLAQVCCPLWAASFISEPFAVTAKNESCQREKASQVSSSSNIQGLYWLYFTVGLPDSFMDRNKFPVAIKNKGFLN